MIMDTCGLNEQEFELVRAAADAAVCRWQSAITQHPSTATTASTRHGHSTTTSSSAAAAGGGGGASAVLLPAAAAAAASTSHTAAAAAAGGGGGGASGGGGGGQQQQLQELGRQLLQCAADGAVEQLELLMQRGAPLTSDWLGTSPLHMAAMYGHRPVAEALLSAGVVRDVRTKVDKTPLHFAAAEGFVDIVRLLLCNGASVDLRDMLNMTALHWAVQRGQTACAELLLQHGASVHVRNKFDKTPVDIAADTSHSQLLRILNNSERYLLESGLAGAVNSASATTTTSSSSSAVQSSSATTTSSAAAAAAAADAEIQPAVDSILNDMALSDTASATTNTVHKQQQHHQQQRQLNLPSSGLHNQNTSPNKVAVGQSSHSQPGLAVLASHGITILPSDDSCLLPSALTAGRRVSLTTAGALALGQTLPSGSPLEPLPTSNTATAAFPTASASVLGGGDGEGGARAKTGVPVAVATSGGRKVTKVIRLTSNQLAKLTGRSGNPTIRLSTSSGVLASSPAPATPQPSTSSASSSSTPLVSSSSSHHSRNTPPLLHSSSLSSSSGSVHSPSLKKLKFVPYQNGDTPPSAPATAPSATAASATPVHLTGDQSPVWAVNGATNRCTISSATQTVQHSTQSVGVCTELSLSQDTAFLASMPAILSPTSAATNTIATTTAAAAAEQTLDPFPDCLLDINSECGDRFAPPPAAGGAAAAGGGGGGGEGQFMEEEEEDGDEDADTWDRSTLARRLSRAEQLASSYQLRAERCRARASRYRRLLAAKHPR